MKLKYITEQEEFELKQSHNGDAGMDVIATSVNIVGNKGRMVHRGVLQDFYTHIDYIEYGIDLAIEPENENWVLAVPRSSLRKYNLVLANSAGIIDTAYRGKILFCFKYIFQPEDLAIREMNNIYGRVNMDKIYKVGDRIGQLILMNHVPVTPEKVKELNDTIRGVGGFGSTGK